MAEQVLTSPAPLTTVPATFALHYRIAVTGVAATLVSLLPGGVVPVIPKATITGQIHTFQFGFVDLQSEVDPSLVNIRVTYDGQTVPTTTLGFLLPGQPSFMRVPVDPTKIQLIASAAGPTNVQVFLGVTALD